MKSDIWTVHVANVPVPPAGRVEAAGSADKSQTGSVETDRHLP